MNRKIFAADEKYLILPVEDEDHDNYVELHRQLNGNETLFLNPICKDMMWEQVLTGKDKVYSIFSKEGEYCGSIELQNSETNTPEIGVDLLENKRNQGIGPRTVKIFAKACYETRKVDYFLIRISSRNPHSKHVFEKMGVIPLKTTEGVFKTFIKDFKGRISDTVSVDEIEGNLMRFWGENAESAEEERVYEYKLTPELLYENSAL